MASSPTHELVNGIQQDEAAAPAPQIPDSRDRTTSPPIYPSSDPPPNTRRCFICLTDEPEASLSADWSTPCTCSLEGHHECLMAWVTDLESQDKDIKCPICKSPIIIMERRDRVIQFSNFINKKFSQWSPRILFGFIASGALVSSSIYGAKAIDLFAGPEATVNFLLDTEDLTLLDIMRQQNQTAHREIGPPINLLRVAVLPLIAPGLVLNRLRLGEVVLIPASLLYATLIDQTNEYLSWPPSAERAIALFPALKATYFHIHGTLSKHLEKKWEAQAKKQILNETDEQHPPIADNQPEPEEERGGIFGIIDIQLGIEEEGDDDDLAVGNGNAGDNNNQLNRRNRALENGRSPINFLAGALMWPGVCYGMGEILRLAMPSRFITRPASGPNTGILQERWGRSLVGGCLFVVLKDAFFLYVKYRRTMNRASRRIKNVENRPIRR
ncbi:uncharacterized protein F4822DRAFT_422086 [Hypoxylon trugodes]|uniref:uncharacterized protein n=1 Tax=Hypoxylon trugodes TaxID=326681 RepID=UPI0021999E81|nr:uncharacterized protein F4822DRAFT_422086 [Hypoxylon trugodes]KAI1383071.1 hypothetical protein F4822DRAFT_422086 [Hypoxylon trugodes]